MTPSLFRRTTIAFAAVAMLGAVAPACSDDEAAPATTMPATSSSATPPTPTEPSTTDAATTPPPTTLPSTSQPSTSQPASTQPTSTRPATSVPATLEQPAVWPAAGVALATPEEAAVGFVEAVLGVPAVLGEFRAGDARSGEIEVFSPGEGGPGSTVVRSLLLLRMLGPDSGWFVTAAVRPEVSIDSPAHGVTVPAAPLVVSGAARGFEATIIVRAVVVGDDGMPNDLVAPVIAAGGALETPEPYAAEVDLTGVPAGTVVAIVVRGDTGLETDPGEFSAIAVVVG